MKELNLLFIYLFFNLLNITFEQGIIIPITPIDNDNDNKPIIETREIKGEDGSNIKITRIHFHSGKNLNGNSQGATPFQIMRIFDDRVSSVFEEIIRQTFGINEMLDAVDKDEDNKNSKDEDEGGDIFDELEKQFELEEDDNNKKNKSNTIIDKDKNETNGAKNQTKQTENKKGKKILNKKGKNGKKKIGKLSMLKMAKNKKIKRKKKLSKKELIFSRVCKYLFYSLILFTIYMLIKKLLEFLEIIDSESVQEEKIPDEETTKLKKSENKIN